MRRWRRRRPFLGVLVVIIVIVVLAYTRNPAQFSASILGAVSSLIPPVLTVAALIYLLKMLFWL